jgi:hypothetical protein
MDLTCDTPFFGHVAVLLSDISYELDQESYHAHGIHITGHQVLHY